MPLRRIAVLSATLVFLFISADASAKPLTSHARVPDWCGRLLAKPAIRERIKPLGEGRYLVNARLWRERPGAENPRCRVVPSFRDGRAIGFKLFGIRPGSAEGQAGLTNGDTVRSIDEEELSSPDRALTIYGRLREIDFFRAVIERRGAEVLLEYCVDRRPAK